MITIRRRLTRDLLAASLILLGAGGLAFYAIARDELIEQFDSALQAKALAVSALAERDSASWRLVAADGISRDFGPDRRRDFFEIWPPGGLPVIRSDSLHGADLVPAKTGTERWPYWSLTLPTGRPGRAIAVRFQPRTAATDQIADSGEQALVVVASNRAGLDEALANLLWSAGAGGALLLAAILWGVPRILRRGLRPLDQLGEAVGAIGPETLGARLAEARLPDELRPIAARLNEFLGRLERSFERERRFSSDLAHELRTPIAELRTAAECGLKWPEARDPAHDREVLAIAQHMELLVNQLLALARGEQGEIAIRRADLSLEACVAEAWAPFAPRAAERNLRARIELRPAPIAADPTLLRSLLHNLFDNAVDYTPEGGEVRISIETGAGPARLLVANSVEGLGPADVDRLFDRFWRKEAARSDQRHLGLGLPLSRVFAQAMGCALSAALDPANSRLVFTLTTGA
ncbi:MAG TPA: ATP-binding protein [Opitutaceae bacterium]|jgi:two-component system sensor histidine kinase QseC|nr:ATP-binding protein [Opitutaceae bacterium]